MANGAFPFVMKLSDGRFRMFYVSHDPNEGQYHFLSAISSNGIDFTAEEGHRYDAGSEYEDRIQAPRVIQLDNGTYRMYFNGISGTGENELVVVLSASSPDGFDFTRDKDIRIDPRVPPLTGGRAAHAWPIKNPDGTIKLYFSGVVIDGGEGIASASSTDGLEFTVDTPVALENPEGGLTLQDPCVIPITGGLRMYYGIYRGADFVEESGIYSAINLTE